MWRVEIHVPLLNGLIRLRSTLDLAVFHLATSNMAQRYVALCAMLPFMCAMLLFLYTDSEMPLSTIKMPLSTIVMSYSTDPGHYDSGKHPIH